jgi:hypothetical protein
MSMVFQKEIDKLTGIVTITKIYGVSPRNHLPPQYLKVMPRIFQKNVKKGKKNEGVILVYDNGAGEAIFEDIFPGKQFDSKRWEYLTKKIATAGDRLHEIREKTRKTICADIF